MTDRSEISVHSHRVPQPIPSNSHNAPNTGALCIFAPLFCIVALSTDRSFEVLDLGDTTRVNQLSPRDERENQFDD